MGIFDRLTAQLDNLIQPDEVRLRVQKGEERLAVGDLDGALVELSWAVMRAPDHARAAYLVGVVLSRKGELNGAAQALEQALAVRPDLGEAQLLLADVLVRLGRPGDALERYRLALEAAGRPEDLASAYRGRGALHLFAGRPDKAVRELRKAVAALPADGEANRLLGLALAARGDLDGARICFEKAAAALLRADEIDTERPSEDAGSTEIAAKEKAGASQKELAAILALLGEVHRRLGRRVDAEARLGRAASLAPSSSVVHLVLARLRLDAGAVDEARREAEEALSAAASDGNELAIDVQPTVTAHGFGRLAIRVLFAAPSLVAAARLQVGRAAARAGDAQAALAAFDESIAEASEDARAHPASEGDSEGLGDSRAALLDEAMHLALGAELEERAASYATALVNAGFARAALADGHSDDPAASAAESDLLAALALGRLAAGDVDSAEPLANRAVAVDTVEARLAIARVHLARGRRGAAAAALRLAAERAPSDPRPRARLASLYREGQEPTQQDLYALLVAAHRQLQKAPETSDLAPEAARIVEILDRPLLLTVMGEFNAGKSTFVNALAGEQVAPMGITPTTATINVLKYGAERGGRVVYRDDTLRHVAWEEVGPLLRALDDEEASRIRFVEVLYPHETLQRVNIVDTPGLNSIRPEHESTAREFIAQADAVIWLFSCRQPGTASEREAIRRIHDEGRKVLGVVNMIDLVEGDDDAKQEVLRHLQSTFGDLVEAFVPFSAREALLGRTNPERLARSNRAELDRVLAERFFDKAKAIQREVAARRLHTLLDEAERRATRLREAGDRAKVEQAEAAARVSRVAFLGRFLDEERQRCVERLGDLYAQAAREVLEFVRPRRWPFGANEAQKADRDFLVALVEQQLVELAADSFTRVSAAAAREASGLASLDSREAETLVAEEMPRLDGQVYGRYRAFVRGYLRGGRVDEFFTRVLPRIDLGEPAIERALLRDMPALNVLDEELVAPLGAWAAALSDHIAERLRRLAQADDLRRLEVEERLAAPITAMRQSLVAAGYAQTPPAPTPAASSPSPVDSPPETLRSAPPSEAPDPAHD